MNQRGREGKREREREGERERKKERQRVRETKRGDGRAPPLPSTHERRLTDLIPTVRTGSWTGPPRGKRAPRVGVISTVFETDEYS